MCIQRFLRFQDLHVFFYPDIPLSFFAYDFVRFYFDLHCLRKKLTRVWYFTSAKLNKMSLISVNTNNKVTLNRNENF